MAWIVEYGCFYEDPKVDPYRSPSFGPYSMAGNRWRDTLTDLADPEGKHTGNVPDSFPILPAWPGEPLKKGPRAEDKLYKTRTPGWDTDKHGEKR